MRKMTAAAGTAVFLVIAPGVVAGRVPWLLTGWRAGSPNPVPARVAGAVLAAAGAVVVICAFAHFVIDGRGTPAPPAPTERLVVRGFYRYVRNPMYLAVLAVIAGQALVFSRLVLLAYRPSWASPSARSPAGMNSRSWPGGSARNMRATGRTCPDGCPGCRAPGRYRRDEPAGRSGRLSQGPLVPGQGPAPAVTDGMPPTCDTALRRRSWVSIIQSRTAGHWSRSLIFGPLNLDSIRHPLLSGRSSNSSSPPKTSAISAL